MAIVLELTSAVTRFKVEFPQTFLSALSLRLDDLKSSVVNSLERSETDR
jgi:hypothetical protein